MSGTRPPRCSPTAAATATAPPRKPSNAGATPPTSSSSPPSSRPERRYRRTASAPSDVIGLEDGGAAGLEGSQPFGNSPAFTAVGGIRLWLACSYAYANRMSLGSYQARPRNDRLPRL